MPISFNLIYEPWIPCIQLKGKRVELSLRDTLAQAHEIREVVDNSPLVTAALYRLLLAILHRNFGPPAMQEWERLYNEGRFDASKLEEYWRVWENRFNLFDKQRPFYQSQDEDVVSAREHPLARLAEELSSGNNETLFDHSIDALPKVWPHAVAARLLVATQNFAVGGGVSKPFNLSHGPLVRGALTIIRGRSLFHTLVFNMVLYKKNDLPSQVPANDRESPAWELDKPSKASKRTLNGYLDLLTVQSRRILLIPADEKNTRGVKVQQGDAIQEQSYMDPMVAYKSKDPKRGYIPLRFGETRSLWRDSVVLLSSMTEMVRNPEPVSQMSRAMMTIPELEAEPVSLDVLGFKPHDRKSAKINLWRHERMPLPLAYLANEDLVASLETALQMAEGVGRAVQNTLRGLATKLLVPFEDTQAKPDKDAVSTLAKSFPSLSYYWASLEPHFHDLYLTIPKDSNRALENWNGVLRKTAWDSLNRTINGLDGSSRSLQAAVKARRNLSAGLKKTLPEKEVVAHV